MSKFSQQVVVVVGVAFLFAMLYFGTYLPFQKSSAYITALDNAQALSSFDAFKQNFATPLDLLSPIGQDELVRNFVNTMSDVIQQNAQKNPEIATQGLAMVDHYAQPILTSGRGLSFAQTVLVTGTAYENAYLATGNVQYSDMARKYFEQGLEISPNRPQFLYGLFGDYRARGDTAKMQEIAAKILSLWPADTQIRSMLGSTTTAASATSPKP